MKQNTQTEPSIWNRIWRRSTQFWWSMACTEKGGRIIGIDHVSQPVLSGTVPIIPIPIIPMPAYPSTPIITGRLYWVSMFHWYLLPNYCTSLALSLFLSLPKTPKLNLRRASRNLHLVHNLLLPFRLELLFFLLRSLSSPSCRSLQSIPWVLSVHFSVSFRSFP